MNNPNISTKDSYDKLNYVQYLLCSYADMYYGIPLNIIHEVVEVSTEYKLPIPKEGITGLINVRNSVFGLIAPDKIFTKIKSTSDTTNNNTCIILCDINNIEFGIKVDNVYEVISIDPNNLHDISSTSKEVEQSAAKYLCEIDNKTITCIDENKLLTLLLHNTHPMN